MVTMFMSLRQFLAMRGFLNLQIEGVTDQTGIKFGTFLLGRHLVESAFKDLWSAYGCTYLPILKPPRTSGVCPGAT